MSEKGLQQYRTNEINTADSRKLILLLYEGAIKFLQCAKQKAEMADVAARAYNLNRATAILLELLRCLDMERGGEIAMNLRALYIFMLRRLLQANLQNDPRMIGECIAIVENLHAGWEQAMMKPLAAINAEPRAGLPCSLQI